MKQNKEIYTKDIVKIFEIMLEQVFKPELGKDKTAELIQNLKNEEGVDVKMMAVLDTIREENERIFNDGMKVGIKSGIKSGIKTGIKQNKIEIVKNMLKEKLPLELIAKITGVSEKEINKIK